MTKQNMIEQPGVFALAGANANITSMTGLTGLIEQPTGIADTSGNIVLRFAYTASSVNYFTITNRATGSGPLFTATGSDSVVSGVFQSKGGQYIILDSGATKGGTLTLMNAANTYGVGFASPATGLVASTVWVLPSADSVGVMTSNGSSVLSLGPLALTSSNATAAYTDISGSITVTGFTGSPTVVARTCVIGKQVNFQFSITGTSNATGFTITGMPKGLNATLGTLYMPILTTNAGVNGVGLFTINGTTVTFYNSALSVTFTNTGTKSAYGSVTYESS